ncbi:hypothetical protein ACIA8O_07320 [Kitasatospora sp. NPDC051853]|uniref:hypothetical protein n=1 Tax=Kitasatospora sp. NPDC051853 TaxID=3364058 RepID=UPI0037996619
MALGEEIEIEIVMVDEADGLPVGSTDYPAEELPEHLEAGARIGIDGVHWEVVRAAPSARAEVIAAGRTVLTVRRVDTADPRQIGYTLPTICAELPLLSPAAGGGGEDLVIHEDDWRQTELVERRLLAGVEAELRAVRRIRDECSHRVGDEDTASWGFREIHLRRGPVEPLVGALSLDRLYELLPVSRTYTGVSLRDGQGRVAGSFALEVAGGAGPVTLYGRCFGERVAALALRAEVAPDAVPGLARLMAEHDLLLVDWCTGRCTGPDGSAP